MDHPLPEGVRDLLFADAAVWRELEAALRDTWQAWGYREIILPTFEYADTLATDVGAGIDAEMYRFFDRHGRTLALRPDMTIPTARVVGTRLYDQSLPLRIAYVGSVFRYEPPRAGRQHEFTQAGVELIGAPTRVADAEAIALAVAALRAAGLPEFRITVGHVGFFHGLMAALELPARLVELTRSAIDRKAEAELAALVTEAGQLAPRGREALLNLPLLSGDASVLAKSQAYVMNPLMRTALDELAELSALVEAHGVSDAVDYDLSEVRDLDYYTGITFEGFAPGLGFSLISGGRYDDLVGHFGPALPAVGWALTLDRLALAREIQRVDGGLEPADALVAARPAPAALAWAAEARRRGLCIEMDALGLAPDGLWAAAQERGLRRAVAFGDGTHLEVRDAAGLHRVGLSDWEEVETWRRAR
jgi:ATP phosphoribosyltransferase regulatory subunit